MLPLFTFGVQFMATEKKVWNTTFYILDVYNIHQNFANQYNDRIDLIVKTSFCLLASNCNSS